MNDLILQGVLLDEEAELSLEELCYACSSSTKWIIALVEVGVLDPVNYQQTPVEQQTLWKFSAYSLKRARTAMRLQRDLGVNEAGVALVLDLLEEIETLEARLNRYKAPMINHS
ncbi:chaperone modulator CbpM [Colwellia ponticola]|uniref:MerR family transcriptional regulator n=1 Tax=Colwellia ponticola TaxID=2304625 RepID=A0A8H2JKJ4_9GAMM|nr:chaperone modulator CbpM [Colwellia ponticola]TMM43268.1 MerR family transcriptional regulator [Colwellia ponticola]